MSRRPTRATIRDRWTRADGSPSSEAGSGRRWIVEFYAPGATRVTRESFSAKAAAEHRMSELNRQTENGASPIGLRGDLTFAEWADRYLTMIGGLAVNTRESRESVCRLHVTPIIGEIRLANLEQSDVVRVVESWAAAKHSVKVNRLNVLNIVLNRAVADRRLVANPAKGIGVGKAPVGKRRDLLTDDEAAAILAGVPDRFRLFCRLVMVTGMRESELCGLTHEQITRLPSGEAMIHVDRQLTSTKARSNGAVGVELFGAVKGDRSDRFVKIDRVTVAELDEYEARYGRGRDGLVFVPGARSAIFTQSSASALMRQHIAPIIGETRKRELGAWHGFRRYCASRLRQAGYSSAEVAAWLGNSVAVLERSYNLPSTGAENMDLSAITSALDRPRERHLTAVAS
jgi:integrase